MKTSCFSIATDDSNDQGLEKINPATVMIFDVNQYKEGDKTFSILAKLLPLFQNWLKG